MALVQDDGDTCQSGFRAGSVSIGMGYANLDKTLSLRLRKRRGKLHGIGGLCLNGEYSTR